MYEVYVVCFSLKCMLISLHYQFIYVYMSYFWSLCCQFKSNFSLYRANSQQKLSNDTLPWTIHLWYNKLTCKLIQFERKCDKIVTASKKSKYVSTLFKRKMNPQIGLQANMKFILIQSKVEVQHSDECINHT